jgi:hypothetical protein
MLLSPGGLVNREARETSDSVDHISDTCDNPVLAGFAESWLVPHCEDSAWPCLLLPNNVAWMDLVCEFSFLPVSPVAINTPLI